MAKKLVTLKVEEADIARWDAKAKAHGISRALLIARSIDAYPPTPGLQQRLEKAEEKVKAGPVKRPPRRAPRSINVAAMDIAEFGHKPPPGSMLKQPKKGK